MIRKLSILTGAALFSLLTAMAQKEPADYVNPFVGTTNYGTTNPGALCPQGMMSVTPLNVLGAVPENKINKDSTWWSTPYEFHNCSCQPEWCGLPRIRLFVADADHRKAEC